MRKLVEKKGFTLIEMLACTVTLILIGLICSTGIRLATLSLQESSFESDSQMLESTLNMYMSDMLRHCTEVTIDGEGNVISFTNDTYYIDEGNFEIRSTAPEGMDAGYLICTSTLTLEGKDGTMVVNEGAYARTLYIKDFALKYDKEKAVFTGSYKIVSSEINSTKECVFSYRTIAMQ